MLWANFLHWYQPPTQKPYWIRRIADESYRPLLRGLRARPHAKLSLNVSGVLLDHFEGLGLTDVIDDLRELLKAGQIEITGSAKFHPLLPFLSREEVMRQIILQEETLRKHFGDLWKPMGFFPPEMGFARSVAESAAELGYRWIIIDELSFPVIEDLKAPRVDYGKRYTMFGLSNFHIYFRERRISWLILSGQVGTGKLLMSHLGERLRERGYLLTAMDGETFGHHRPGLQELLFEIYDSGLVENVLISDLEKRIEELAVVEPTPSTWALMEKDLEKHEPFSRWKDDRNAIHAMQWELTELAIKAVREGHQELAGYPAARYLLDRALHSDQYWWASARPWWSIEMIERGAKELRDVVMTAPGVKEEMRTRAQFLYQTIIFTAFEWQRNGIVDDLARMEDEEIRQRTDTGIPRLPKEEIKVMTDNLRKEMALLVKQEEFERAANIRDRIRELEGYASEEEEKVPEEAA